jgi:hypothetical protein
VPVWLQEQDWALDGVLASGMGGGSASGMDGVPASGLVLAGAECPGPGMAAE